MPRTSTPARASGKSRFASSAKRRRQSSSVRTKRASARSGPSGSSTRKVRNLDATRIAAKRKQPARQKHRPSPPVPADAARIKATLDQLAKAQEKLTARAVDLLAVAHN